jgi:hypothetical protein
MPFEVKCASQLFGRSCCGQCFAIMIGAEHAQNGGQSRERRQDRAHVHQKVGGDVWNQGAAAGIAARQAMPRSELVRLIGSSGARQNADFMDQAQPFCFVHAKACFARRSTSISASGRPHAAAMSVSVCRSMPSSCFVSVI